MVFIETSIFTKLQSKHMNDEEYCLFQLYLMYNPEKGDIIKGSGGIRVIYYWKDKASEIWLLTLYAKNEKDSISSHILKQIAQEIQDD